MINLCSLPFPRLELIDDLMPRPAAFNMAMDEVLLAHLSGDPVMRIYRWARPTISIGYFEPVESAEGQWPEWDMVRRWTGGGIVEHGEDLTFSLLVPRSVPLATLSAAESYRLIHEAVASALADTGRPRATLKSGLPDADARASRSCFENPVVHDLLLSGRKVAGGAQRRTRRGLLHQGSIQDRVAGQEELLGAPTLCVLSATLPRAFGVSVVERPLRPAEIAATAELARTKYGNDAWLRRT